VVSGASVVWKFSLDGGSLVDAKQIRHRPEAEGRDDG
jgi:hypothetical protein